MLRVQIDYSSIYKELDSLLDDKKKPDYSAMIFNSVEEIRDFNLKFRREMDREVKMVSRGSGLSQNQSKSI